jgi:3-deoxy-D-manno-octulosonic-acid transferase
VARRLYTLCIVALLPWAVVHLLWRSRRQPEYRRHWNERFARYGKPVEAGQPTIWLHAVSVGETRAAQPLVVALRQAYPTHRILFTHMTPTGRATSEAIFGDSVSRIYLPYDTPGAVRRFLRQHRPQFGLIMETELWPNLVAACRELSVPLLLVNARLSERSANRYARFATLTGDTLRSLSAIGAQSADDAARLKKLGAPDVTVSGNLKFDIDIPSAQLALGDKFRRRYGARASWLAASTREGEEALILDAWRRRATGQGALLVLVPRHPQRFADVAQLAREHGFRVQLRSDDAVVAAETEVLIGDSMGEMLAYYASVDLAFIGGSLLDFGSQNLIEAAACGTPILIGPSTRNFADAARAALACGAALPIVDASDLVARVDALLGDADGRARMAVAGKEFAERHRGATARTMELLSRAVR